MLVLQVYEFIISLSHDIFNTIKVQPRLNSCFINTLDDGFKTLRLKIALPDHKD